MASDALVKAHASLAALRRAVWDDLDELAFQLPESRWLDAHRAANVVSAALEEFAQLFGTEDQALAARERITTMAETVASKSHTRALRVRMVDMLDGDSDPRVLRAMLDANAASGSRKVTDDALASLVHAWKSKRAGTRKGVGGKYAQLARVFAVIEGGTFTERSAEDFAKAVRKERVRAAK